MKGQPEMSSPTLQRGNPFRDARHILMVAEVTPGLPFPSIDKHRACFMFTDIVHAEDARQALDEAEAALTTALDVRFVPRPAAQYHFRTALLPSGLWVDLVALAEHITPPAPREDAPRELAEVAA